MIFSRIKGDYDARSVANWFIEKANDDPEQEPKTPLQIMKLVYFSHAWMLGIYDCPLISQKIRAWKYGPVVKELYHDMKHWGDQPVVEPLESGEKVTFDAHASDILNQVYDVYGPLDGFELSSLTHLPESPWFITRMSRFEGAAISDDLIRDYYAERSVSE